jgi:hypothetical protein
VEFGFGIPTACFVDPVPWFAAPRKQIVAIGMVCALVTVKMLQKIDQMVAIQDNCVRERMVVPCL